MGLRREEALTSANASGISLLIDPGKTIAKGRHDPGMILTDFKGENSVAEGDAGRKRIGASECEQEE